MVHAMGTPRLSCATPRGPGPAAAHVYPFLCRPWCHAPFWSLPGPDIDPCRMRPWLFDLPAAARLSETAGLRVFFFTTLVSAGLAGTHSSPSVTFCPVSWA